MAWTLGGFNKKVLPQLAGSIIKIFRNFLRPLRKSSFTTLLNSSTDISFYCRVCSALKYQKLLQSCIQPFCKQSLKISRQPLRDLSISERELIISHVVQIRSSIFLLVLFIRNVNRSSLPLFF